MKNWLESYNGEKGRRLIEPVNENRGKDKNSDMFKYLIEANHTIVKLDNFTVLSRCYRNRNINRKVSESLFITQNRPILNKHDTSFLFK